MRFGNSSHPPRRSTLGLALDFSMRPRRSNLPKGRTLTLYVPSWPNSIDSNAEQRTGIHRYRPARVRAIFQLPRRLRHLCDEKLVHVELFNSPSQNPNPPVGLYTTTRSIHDGIRSTLIVPLVDIAMTCHLAPRYSHFHPENQLIQYADLLQLCEHFYLNIFASYFLYELFRHWGQAGSSAA
ncbi:hypothetical protein RhiJN_24815 [Ceratobasidium sp. AG-Ba]|nr:hypothetical protein RhiJN_24815 [Ceratobasidium sp. AG-Ba]